MNNLLVVMAASLVLLSCAAQNIEDFSKTKSRHEQRIDNAQTKHEQKIERLQKESHRT